MQYGVTDFITHLVYIARWVVLAVPGAWVLQAVRRILVRRGKDSLVVAMLISQGILGMIVFFVDRLIFK